MKRVGEAMIGAVCLLILVLVIGSFLEISMCNHVMDTIVGGLGR